MKANGLLNRYFFFIAAAIYAIVYLVYFSQHLHLSILPGQFDSWLNLAILKDYANIIDHFVLGTPLSTANFPEGKIFLYGEASFLSAPFYWLLLKLTQNDFTAFIGMYVLVYTVNSISLAYFVSKFCRVSLPVAFLSGLVFSFSAFNLGLQDNITYCIFFPAFAGLYCLELWLERDTRYLFYGAVLCFGLQIYFSVYNFFIGLLIVLTWFLIKPVWVKTNFRLLMPSALLMIILISPFIYLFGLHNPTAGYRNFISLEIIDHLGFNFADLSRSFSSNFIYGRFFPVQKPPSDYWHVGNLGILSSVFALVGVILAPKRIRFFIVLLVLISVLFAFGPYYGNANIKSPLYYLYLIAPFLENFKLIFKFYYLIVFGFVMAYTFFLKAMLTYTGNFWFRQVVVLLPVILFLVENVPLNRIEEGGQFKILSLDQKELSELRRPTCSAMILPAYTPTLPNGNNECFAQGRLMEYKYYYLQAHYQFNLINGSNLFIPANRQIVQNILDKNNLSTALSVLQNKFSITAILFDKTSPLKCGFANKDSLAAEFRVSSEYADHIYFKRSAN